MAIGPIGNVVFVNQQTASVASVANAHNNRVDVQNMQAQAAVQEKDEIVLKVRPTEENHAIDPDREHEKNHAQQESDRSQKRDEDEQDEDENFSHTVVPRYKLDIKV